MATRQPRKLSPAVAVLFAVATVTTIAVIKRSQNVAGLQGPESVQKSSTTGTQDARTKCFLYDRPMRTGSSTVIMALVKCFRAKHWSIARHIIGNDRGQTVPINLDVPSKRYAFTHGHMWLGEDDVRLLHSRCDAFVYVSSCAPLWQQLWSAAKMLSNARLNANTTLDERKTERAFDWLRDVNRTKSYMDMYEFYPFIRLTEPMVLPEGVKRFPDLPPHFERAPITTRFVPDFVIRKNNLSDDLPRLLNALSCPQNFTSKNIHETELVDNDIMEKVKEITGAGDGQTYTRLMRVAMDNDKGLERIRAFSAI